MDSLMMIIGGVVWCFAGVGVVHTWKKYMARPQMACMPTSMGPPSQEVKNADMTQS